jgi:hypothetical protein
LAVGNFGLELIQRPAPVRTNPPASRPARLLVGGCFFPANEMIFLVDAFGESR